MMSGDLKLKGHVEDELSWEPSINAAAIGVSVNDAVVTLTGYVGSLSEKHAAEEVVTRIHGVRALASELEVKLPVDSERKDEDIARTAASILQWNTLIPHDRIKVKVSHGWLTLEGTVDWHYQRTIAHLAVKDLMGLKGINDLITVKPVPKHPEAKARLESSLKRNSELNAHRIKVDISDDRVLLSGVVPSLVNRTAAETAAWKIPGIGRVENNIVVIFIETEMPLALHA